MKPKRDSVAYGAKLYKLFRVISVQVALIKRVYCLLHFLPPCKYILVHDSSIMKTSPIKRTVCSVEKFGKSETIG